MLPYWLQDARAMAFSARQDPFSIYMERRQQSNNDQDRKKYMENPRQK
jgi:hypothetical protein